jgi:hypothetical protein
LRWKILDSNLSWGAGAMLVLDCPICERVQGAVPSPNGRTIRCQGCDSTFHQDQVGGVRQAGQEKPAVPDDLDFAHEAYPQPHSAWTSWLAAVGLLAVALLLLGWVTGRSGQKSFDPNANTPTALSTPAAEAQDATPAAAPEPLVDPSSFNQPGLYPRSR